MRKSKDHYLWIEGHADTRVTANQVADWCGVSKATARRWLASGNMPEPARRLVTLSACGGVMPPEWHKRGFRFWGDYLHTENGDYFNRTQLDQIRQYVNWYNTLSVNYQNLQDYSKYLEAHVPKAPVIPFDSEKARPSLTEGQELNHYFQKPK